MLWECMFAVSLTLKDGLLGTGLKQLPIVQKPSVENLLPPDSSGLDNHSAYGAFMCT